MKMVRNPLTLIEFIRNPSKIHKNPIIDKNPFKMKRHPTKNNRNQLESYKIQCGSFSKFLGFLLDLM